MSISEFEARTKDHPEVTAARDRAGQEAAWRPFHAAFLTDAYPFWQGPLVRFSKLAAVESAGHLVRDGFPEGVGVEDVDGPEWIGHELIRVQARVGVEAGIAYAYDGDGVSGRVARIPYRKVAGERATLISGDIAIFSAQTAELVSQIANDVGVAVDIIGKQLLAALADKEELEARRRAQAEAMEKARVEAEERAKQEAIERRKAIEEAALRESQAREEAAAQEAARQAEQPAEAPDRA